MIKKLIALVASFAILLSSKTTVQAGAYKVVNQPNPVVVNCVYGDINCRFSAPVIFQNVAGRDLYKTALWTYGRNIRYTAEGGILTSLLTYLSPIYEPGYGPNLGVVAVVDPNAAPGSSYTERLFIDGKACNIIGSYLDCGYYGGSSFDIIFKIDPIRKSTPQMTPRPRPTKPPVRR